MTTPPLPPLERSSLYPEPHRAGDWSEPTPHHRRWLPSILGMLAMLLLVLGAVALGLKTGKDKGTADVIATDPKGTDINSIQAVPGTCLAELPEDGQVARVTAVPCETPHPAEVVSTYRFSGAEWPGDEDVEARVLSHCGAFIQPGFSADAMFKTSDWEDGLRWVAWLPTMESWDSNERIGACVVYRPDGIIGSFVSNDAVFTD